MDEFNLKEVLLQYGIDFHSVIISPIHQGLINNTWKISGKENTFILQKINEQIFKSPSDIAENILMISEYLKKNHSQYFFVNAINSIEGKSIIQEECFGFFRLFPFVENSHSKNELTNPNQAYEASKQFGRFTKLLNGFNAEKLKITLPSFHDLSLRYKIFLEALIKRNNARIKESEKLIEKIKKWSFIVDEYEQIKLNSAFKLRVTHHDTKIGNVLFNTNDEGVCVIDLDTVMPGYFFSDVGDMMRTYLSPVNEEETDVKKIEVRTEYYKAIVQGYLEEMKDELNEVEKKYFFYAGTFMIYMQAIRFLTDYLNNDVYYGAKYPTHNFVRAQNQIVLLQCLFDKKELLEQ